MPIARAFLRISATARFAHSEGATARACGRRGGRNGGDQQDPDRGGGGRRGPLPCPPRAGESGRGGRTGSLRPRPFRPDRHPDRSRTRRPCDRPARGRRAERRCGRSALQRHSRRRRRRRGGKRAGPIPPGLSPPGVLAERRAGGGASPACRPARGGAARTGGCFGRRGVCRPAPGGIRNGARGLRERRRMRRRGSRDRPCAARFRHERVWRQPHRRMRHLPASAAGGLTPGPFPHRQPLHTPTKGGVSDHPPAGAPQSAFPQAPVRHNPHRAEKHPSCCLSFQAVTPHRGRAPRLQELVSADAPRAIAAFPCP